MPQIKADPGIKYWIAFNLILGGQLLPAKKMAALYPSPEVFFRGSAPLPPGIEKKLGRALAQPGLLERAEAELERAERKGYTVLTQKDIRYPPLLREIFDPPYVLYCAGDTDAINNHCISIVGSRRPTAYGRSVAERLAEDLASRGLTVVSGLARGIDSQAHAGALKGGRTVAVLGSGLENIYPKENKKLFDRITQNGAVISEFPLDSPPLGFHFPIRNRVLSGLSRALIVIEAAKRSGSLISARLALEQNREVMAVPGPISSEMSRGTNWLIQSGAKLVEDWADILDELPPAVRGELQIRHENRTTTSKLSSEESRILDLIPSDNALHIDEIIQTSDRSVSEILTILLGLELKDTIHQLPGKYFQRKL